MAALCALGARFVTLGVAVAFGVVVARGERRTPTRVGCGRLGRCRGSLAVRPLSRLSPASRSLIFSASRAVAATRAAVSSSAAGSRCAGVVFAAAGFAAPMTAPERVKRAAFFLPPRAMIFALFLTPRAIWTQKEVKDWEGLFTTRKNSLSGVSRMSTLVCCELSRAKQVVARDGSYVRFGSNSLIGAY